MVKRQIPQAVSPTTVAPQARIPVQEVFLVLAGLIVLFRITIWKFFPPCETFVKEDLSNILVADASLLVVSAWLVLHIVRRGSFRPSGFEVPVLLFLGAAFGSLLYSVDFSSTLTGVLVLFAQVAFFFMLQDILGDRERIMRFLYFLIACAVLVAIFGVKEFIFLSWRPALPTDAELARIDKSLHYVLVSRRAVSFLGWPNTLAGYLMLFLPIAAACAVATKARWLKILFLLGSFVMVACFVFTFSFLGWLSFLVATTIVFVLSWKRLRVHDWPRGQKIALVGLSVAFLMLFGWVIARKNFAAAMTPRLEYYKNAIELLKTRPLLGHGWETFGIASRKFVTSNEGLTSYVHNSYLQAWVETGIVGLIGILLLFWVFARRAISVLRRPVSGGGQIVLWAVVWGLGAFFFDNLFSFTILKPHISFYFWVMLAVFVALCREVSDDKDIVSPGPWPSILWLVSVLVVLGFLFWMTIAFWNYQSGMEALKRKEIGGAEQRLYRAQVWSPWRASFRAGLGQIYLSAYFTTGEEKFFDRAEAQYWQAVSRSPLNYGNYFILSKLYERHGDKTKAEQLAKVAKTLSPYQYEQDLKVLAEMAERRKLTGGGSP